MPHPSGPAVLAAVTLLLGGCGGEIVGNLFEVRRDGTGPGARLTLLVNDDGFVRCNGGDRLRMPEDLLLDARQIIRDIGKQDLKLVPLPPGPQSVLRYRVRLADRSYVFSDTSRGLPEELVPFQGFTRRIAKEVCGLAR